MTLRDKVIEQIKDSFPHYKGEVNESTVASQVAGWDSFSHVQLMFALEDKLGCEFDPTETFELKNVGDLILFLERRANT